MRDFFLSLHLSPHRAPSGTVVGRHGPIRCQRQHRRLNLVSPITGVPTLESAFKLETFLNCVFLSKDGELRTECRDVQFRYFLIELLQEVDLVLLGCSSMLIRNQIKLQQHWFVKDQDIRKE